MNLLPIGTYVRVDEPGDDGRKFKAIVRGYDMGESKYHLSPEYMPGKYTAKPISWAFPKWVEVDTVQTMIAENNTDGLMEYFGTWFVVALSSRKEVAEARDAMVEVLEREWKALQKKALQIEHTIAYIREG